jgi:hypothetical protein
MLVLQTGSFNAVLIGQPRRLLALKAAADAKSAHRGDAEGEPTMQSG